MKGDIGYQPPSLPPDKYTIGWISAIPTELTAAKAMLDVTHGPLKFQPKHDENNVCSFVVTFDSANLEGQEFSMSLEPF
jgi:hypothetical protein